jgi:hypothetical protein
MTTEYYMPPNEARIERLYAFMSIDAKGSNGVVAGILPSLGSTPLVTSKRSVAKSLIPVAQDVAKNTGLTVGLYVFARVEGEELWRSE